MKRLKQTPLGFDDRVQHRIEIRQLISSPIGQPGNEVETEMAERFKRTFAEPKQKPKQSRR